MRYRKIFGTALVILFVAVYTFSQAMQTAPDRLAAEKILAASEILSGERSLFSWPSNLLELILYLPCVLAFKLSAFAGIAELTVFFGLLFCTVLWMLRREGILSFCPVLILLALCGLPNPEWLRGLRDLEGLSFFLLTAPFLLAEWSRRRERKYAAGLICLVPLCLSPKDLSGFSFGRSFSVHGTFRALQKVFRADFSQMPIISLSTCRYFLLSLVLLLFLAAQVRIIARLIWWAPVSPAEACFTCAVLLTLAVSCFHRDEDGAARVRICSWIPFGAALMLALLSEDPSVKKLRAVQNRIPFTTVLCVFFAAAALSGPGPVVRSRPASPADLAAGFLAEQGLSQGACPEEDLALLKVAAKGRIRFTAETEDPGNEFLITREGDDPMFGPYRVEILPRQDEADRKESNE